MASNDQLCLPEGLDPRSDREVFFLVPAATTNAPGDVVILPDVPLEALFQYFNEINEATNTPLKVSSGMIRAEVAASHLAMRNAAEMLRRDLVQAVKMYNDAGRKMTDDLAKFIQSAQTSARTTLANIPIQTSTYRKFTEQGFSLQFGNVTKPWAKGVKNKILKPPVALYSWEELLENPKKKTAGQAHFRQSEKILVAPRALIKVLDKFDRFMLVLEVAQGLYFGLKATSNKEYEQAIIQFENAAVAGAADAGGTWAAAQAFAFCMEVGLLFTVTTTPAGGFAAVLACGVASAYTGVVVGDAIKKIPRAVTPVPKAPTIGPMP